MSLVRSQLCKKRLPNLRQTFARFLCVGIGQSIAACMREIGGTMMVIVVGADCRQAGGLSLPFRRKNRHRLREPAKMSWRNLGRSFSVTKFCTGCSPLLRFSTTFSTLSAADMKLISLMLCQIRWKLGLNYKRS